MSLPLDSWLRSIDSLEPRKPTLFSLGLRARSLKKREPPGRRHFSKLGLRVLLRLRARSGHCPRNRPALAHRGGLRFSRFSSFSVARRDVKLSVFAISAFSAVARGRITSRGHGKRGACSRRRLPDSGR